MSDVSALRQCFIYGLPDQVQAENFTPPPEQIYLPPSHRRALSPDRPLVLGGRGAGKTFWLESLRDKDKRELVAVAFDMPALAKTVVKVGFSASAPDPELFLPDSRTLGNLLGKRLEPYDIWSAVVLAAIVGRKKLPGETWEKTVEWVSGNGEAVSRLLQSAESENSKQGLTQLILFDELDRTAPRSWEATQDLVRGLLMTALEFRSYRTLRIKLFIRPDMLERRVTAFPDASKLIDNAVNLAWSDTDLYGLLWQYLGNGAKPDLAALFRKHAEAITRTQWKQIDHSFPVPEPLRTDAELQQRLFHALAGKTMGGGPNRGDTWKWLPNHLADENGYVSPRSFIKAVLHATNDSAKRDPSAKEATPLLWRAIQEGVAEASKTRVNELGEDFPWVADALLPLTGLAVPCSEKEILQLWKQAGTLKIVSERDTGRLPPVNVRSEEPRTLLTVLVALGVFRIMSDKRINMPDIFRVEAKMPRRGGVPVRRQ
jgi:hypothetical protein